MLLWYCLEFAFDLTLWCLLFWLFMFGLVFVVWQALAVWFCLGFLVVCVEIVLFTWFLFCCIVISVNDLFCLIVLAMVVLVACVKECWWLWFDWLLLWLLICRLWYVFERFVYCLVILLFIWCLFVDCFDRWLGVVNSVATFFPYFVLFVFDVYFVIPCWLLVVYCWLGGLFCLILFDLELLYFASGCLVGSIVSVLGLRLFLDLLDVIKFGLVFEG